MSDLKTAAREAWIYALPLIEVATMRQRAMGFGQRMGAFTHVRNLATPKHRAVTTPNNDTLYTSAHIDLSQGPVTLTSRSVSSPPEMSSSITWPTPFAYHFSPTIPGSSGVHSPVTVAPR